jgi:cob(I)alamin adenosyltransferase
MKIYTRTGDDGSTGLIGGNRVQKDDAAIECYGTVDELNAMLGLAAVAADEDARGLLQHVQAELFTIGSHLATPAGAKQAASLPTLDETWIARLEQQIDAAESTLAPLRNFILPGGSEFASRMHVARAVCRRAERLLVAAARERSCDPVILTYFNRLSDWLFVQARRANHIAGVADVPWRGK